MPALRPKYNMNTGKVTYETLLGVPSTDEVVFKFASGVEFAIGRGATDADRTYSRVTRSDGTSVYNYVDTGTTAAVSTTKP